MAAFTVRCKAHHVGVDPTCPTCIGITEGFREVHEEQQAMRAAGKPDADLVELVFE